MDDLSTFDRKIITHLGQNILRCY